GRAPRRPGSRRGALRPAPRAAARRRTGAACRSCPGTAQGAIRRTREGAAGGRRRTGGCALRARRDRRAVRWPASWFLAELYLSAVAKSTNVLETSGSKMLTSQETSFLPKRWVVDRW